MTLEEASTGFAACGSEARLSVLLLLVRAGSTGLTVGDIQAHTAIPASTLAHHLRTLHDAGLVSQQREGRTIVTRAAYHPLEELAAYLLNECCAGVDAHAADSECAA